jgi:hypothetical protein
MPPQYDGGQTDLCRVLIAEGRGFVAGVQIAPDRDHGFVCAVNAKDSPAFGKFSVGWIILSSGFIKGVHS